MEEYPTNICAQHRRVASCASILVICVGLFFTLSLRQASAAPLQVAGNLAFLPDQLGQLKTAALSGTNVTIISTSSNLTGITAISLRDQYAFVAVANKGVFVFDVSQSPPNLVAGGQFTSRGSAHDIKVTGTTAFLADGEQGIAVIDLFDPAMPTMLPGLYPPGGVTSVDIASDRLYATCGPAGLFIADISNVTEVSALAQFSTATPARRVRIIGNYAYVLCDGPRLEIINVQTPAAPTLVSAYVTSGYLSDVDISGNYAVVANTNGALTVLDLTNPGAPVVQSTNLIPGGAFAVLLSGENAYVRTGAGDLVVVPLPVLASVAPQLQQAVPPRLVAVGQTAVFSVLASGSSPMTYRWSSNGVPLTDDLRISGSTNAWLLISDVQLSDAGVYSVMVSNSVGHLISSNTLTVVQPGAPIWRGSFNPGGTVESVDVNNFRVYAAAGTNGLEIYSALNPRYPERFGDNPDQRISGTPVNGYALGVSVNEDYAFVATTTNGLKIFNASAFDTFEVTTATNTLSDTRAVHFADGFAYVADGVGGLQVFQLAYGTTNILNFAGSYNTPGFARNVFVGNGVAYVADGMSGLQILAVTNPAAIIKIGEYDTPGEARNVKVLGNVAYVADGANGLVILNVASPASPTLLGTYPSGVPALDLDLALDTVVLARGANGVEVLNVANPASIISLGSWLGTPANGLRVAGNRLYVAAGDAGVQIFELLGLPISFPEVTVTPTNFVTLAGSTVTFQANATGTAPLTYQWFKGRTPLSDNLVIHGARSATLVRSNLTLNDSGDYFVVVRNGWRLPAIAKVKLAVVSVGTPVVRASSFADSDPLNIHVVGQIAFVASRLNGLQAIDCSDPSDPVLVGEHETLGLAQDVRIQGHYAYVASWDAGLEIFDIIDPTDLVRVGHCDTPGFAHTVRAAGHYVHVADREGGYSIIDVLDPANPVLVGQAATAGFAEGLTVVGTQAYLASADAGLEIFDTSNPLAPARIAQLNTPGNAEGISVVGQRAYVSDYHRGLSIISVANPLAPVMLGELETLGDAFQVQVLDDRAYIAAGLGRISVADVSDPTQPTLVGTSEAGQSVRALQIIGKHAFVADREEGFVVAELLGLSASAPVIMELSPSTTKPVGSDVVLSVAVEGTPPLDYAWYRNGQPLANSAGVTGVTTPHLRFPNLANTNAGNYTVVIDNAEGSVTSVVAQVTVGTLPVSLQDQINAATNGAVIQLAAGTYTENLVIDSEVTLAGSWWNKPELNGGQAGPTLHVLPGAVVTLRGLALRHGASTNLGGGIRNEGTLILDRCLVADNTAVSGGGIANLGTLLMFQSVLSNNIATTAGGGLYNATQAVASVTNSVLIANKAGTGGGLANLGTNTFFSSLLASNLAYGTNGTGGGLRQVAGYCQLINSTLSGNTATSITVRIATGVGGGARVDGGRLDLLFSTVAANTASFRAGGVSATILSEVHARNSIFADNFSPGPHDYAGRLYSDGYNLVQWTNAALVIVGTTTGNQLNVPAQLGLLSDNGGPTWTHAPLAGSPAIDAGIAPGPVTDARGIARPFDIQWRTNVATGWDLGAVEYVDRSLYLVMSNRTSSGFTLAWATNAVLQKSTFLQGGWVDQTNTSPTFVATVNPQNFFRVSAPAVPLVLTTNNATPDSLTLSWPDFGILEHAPATIGPWEPLTGFSPVQVNLAPGQPEYFRLREIAH